MDRLALRETRSDSGLNSGSSHIASSSPITDSRLAALCSEAIQRAFLDYQDQFHQISCLARRRFLDRDWKGSEADASARLRLYNEELDELLTSIRELMGSRVEDRQIWMAAKAVYSAFISQTSLWEIAESFFNSVTRRIFSTQGVDQAIEFVDSDFDSPPTTVAVNYVQKRGEAPLSELLRAALTDVGSGGFEAGLWSNLESNLAQAVERISTMLPGDSQQSVSLEMISTAFYRSRGAYLVGRVLTGVEPLHSLPVAFSLRNREEGIVLDAVMTGEVDLSILFSYTRAYFRANASCPYQLVRQLRELMPRKPLVDLYNGIGYHRHGKTELFRDFVAHLFSSEQTFVTAEGVKGMVMLVFTLPSYDLVFKLIKDRFDYPKNTSREDVKRSYRMVFEHDRAGRLVEAHEFEHLRIREFRFEKCLLERLLQEASQTVVLEGRDLLISHAYVERRVRPLNLYWAESPEPEVIASALDYGQAIKDLAAANVFAGDLFPKNFGVTRTGRVVFYDYDELCLLTECNFRALPVATTIEQEMAAEPWYSVRDNDIFPEEFPRFLGIPDCAQQAFQDKHGDLFTPDYWRDVQDRIRAGKPPDIYPYETSRRLL